MAFVPLAYSRNILRSWPLGSTWYHHTFLFSAPFISKVANFAQLFLRKGILEPAMPDVFDCPLAWSCPQVFNSGLGMRLYEGMFDKELFSCRIFGISKLFQTQKSFWHRFKTNSFWRNSSDSYGEVFRSDEFLFFFLLLTKMGRKRSDIRLVTKGLNFNLKIIENRFQSIYFICMNNDFISHEETLLTDPDCLPLIIKGLIRYVM